MDVVLIDIHVYFISHARIIISYSSFYVGGAPQQKICIDAVLNMSIVLTCTNE